MQKHKIQLWDFIQMQRSKLVVKLVANATTLNLSYKTHDKLTYSATYQVHMGQSVQRETRSNCLHE